MAKRFPTLMALLLIAAAALFAAGTQDAAATEEEIPEIHVWPSMALTDPNGSNPERMAAVQEYIIQEVGVKPIGYVSPGGSEGRTKLNLILGSRNQRMDLFTGAWSDYKDAVIPINDLLDEHGPNVKRAFSATQWAGVTDSEGNIWGIPRLGVMGHTNFTWFNEKMLDEAGLDVPQTWDEMIDAFMRIREMYPEAIILTDGLRNLQRAWVGAFTEHGYSNWMGEDGTLQPAEFQPGYRNFVAQMAEWYTDGYIYKEAFVSHDDVEVFKTGDVAIFAGWYSRVTIHLNRILVSGALPGVDYVMPEGFTSDNGLVMTNNASPSQAMMISKQCPHPELAMKFLNWQYDPDKDNVITAAYGIQGEDWEWVDPSKKYYVNRLRTEPGTVYAGELMAATGLGTDTWYAPNNPDLKRHYEHIRDYALDYSNGKMPFDFDVPYDMAAVRDAVPAFDDISRMRDEETVKFITGIRPISEWDQFINELKRVGIEDLYAEYTRQYKAKKEG